MAGASAATAAAGEPLHYARVDRVAGADGRPMIMEFELVEPELFLRFSPPAVAAFTAAIARALEESGPTRGSRRL